MPQWDLLDFLSGKAKQFPSFNLRMQNEAVDLINEGGRIRGVVVEDARQASGDPRRPGGRLRRTALAHAEGGALRGARVGRADRCAVVPHQPQATTIRRICSATSTTASALILIPRGDYFQIAQVIRKGSFEQIQQKGIEAFRQEVRKIAPVLGDRVEELRDWEQIKLLSVQINRLRQWHRPGLLCIGDAAHAMSPVGGVGINLAIQDAVATANLLGDALRERRVTEAMLARIQERREFPTRVTQFLQVNAHKGLQAIFRNPGPAVAPWQLRPWSAFPGIQKVAARVIGVGVLTEHIKGARQEKMPGTDAEAHRDWRGLLAAGVVIGTKIVQGRRRRQFAWGESRAGF